MKNIILMYYIICAIVCFAFSTLMDVKSWKDIFKNLICSLLAATVVILVGKEYAWSETKVLLGVIIASGYARPVVYGVNRQIKEFFKDPKSYMDRYKGRQ